ncbi:hypothetical protein [Longispora albida]|uniref:hypothetical protein n=1 Tax=Longispora albida TaxID=203523 RepID=UPI0003828E81|nr:hypothetical protein [Longispora albida]
MIDELPGEDELLAAIAKDAGVTEDRARAVLTEAGVGLRPPLPARRQLLIHRYFVRGVKSGTRDGVDGPFAKDVRLGTGTWAIASKDKNSAGKSSLLWALVFALRGESDDVYRRAESFDWFDYIRVDLEVSGVPVSIRLTVHDARDYSVILLTAESIDQLTALDADATTGAGVRVADRADGPGAVAELVSRFMMERLGLRPLDSFAASGTAPVEENGVRDGVVQPHRWPAYFPMIALCSAGDSVLFGKTAVDQLPTRLMQVFLDVPFVADVVAAGTSEKTASQNVRHLERRAREDAQVRVARFGDLPGQLAQARERAAGLRAAVPAVDGLRTAARGAAAEVARLERRASELSRLRELARTARIEDARRHRELSESAAARAMFGALNPRACPRCENPIDSERKAREEATHECAVCTTPMVIGESSEEERQAALSQASERLRASRAAESATTRDEEAAQAALLSARDRQRAAQAALDAALGGPDVQEQITAAELEVARLSGALQLLDQLAEPQPVEYDDVPVILAAAKAALNQLAADTTRELFDELNQEIVDLARELGVANLDSVKLALGGQLNARKSGAAKPTAFKLFSPGERVRLRIAIIVSLISVGRRHGIHSHPGLLLIDSPADVEIVPGDVKIMFEKLAALGEEHGLQVIMTTGHDAAWETFRPERLIVGPDNKHLF